MKSLYNSKNLALYAGSISGTFSTSKLYNIASIIKRCTDIKKSNLVLVTNSVPYDGNQEYSMTFSLELGTQNYELYEFEGSISLVKGTNYITRDLGLRTYIGSADSAVSGNVYGYAWQKNYGTYGQLKIDGYTDVELPTSYAKIEFEGTFKVPTIGSITCNQLDTRNPINVSWTADIQDICEINVKQNGVIVYTTSGTTSKSISIPVGILTSGAFEVEIIVANNPYSNLGASATKSQSFTAISTAPVITSLEPDSVNQNINNPITISWNTINQEAYSLNVKQNGILLKSYTGETAKSLTLPADTAKTGYVTLELSVSNTVNGIVATNTKAVSFLGYGKPDKPIQEEQTVYNNARPTFSWKAPEQVAYQLQMFKNNILVEDSGQMTSVLTKYTAVEIMDNNTDYVIKIRIKNQYNLWSEYSEKKVTISYIELTKPTINTVSGLGGILINGHCTDELGFAYAEIWRREEKGIWARIGCYFGLEISITDTTTAHEQIYEYKIRAYSADGGIIDSDISSNKSVMDYVTIEDIESKELIRLPYLGDRSCDNINDITLQYYAGVSKPRIEKSSLDFSTRKLMVAVNMEMRRKLEYILKNGKVLLFRDLLGNRMYCALSSGIQKDETGKRTYHKMTFSLTEVAFVEKDMYSGARKLVLTYFDGTYYFDGTIDFSGEHWEG